MHAELGLAFGDSLPRRRQLCPFTRPEPRLLTAVETLLPTPGVDRLAADAEVPSNFVHLASRRNEFQHPLAELRRISALANNYLARREPARSIPPLQQALESRPDREDLAFKPQSDGSTREGFEPWLYRR